jgi:ABC-type antimicrobial peptide transport system permease subunit
MNGHAFSGASARGGLSLPIRPTSPVRDRQGDLGLQPVDRAEIVNYRSTGTTPTLLAVGLAPGAMTALGLTLAASVRQRRRDLALLKTLGFTRRQLLATVGLQASVAARVGVVVGVPLGIVSGRRLWTLFAREIFAVPYPSVPVGQIIIVVVGALMLATLVAIPLGLSAARTRTSLLLRAE